MFSTPQTDQGAYYEGLLGRSGHSSPIPEAPPDPPQTDSISEVPYTPSTASGRPLRARSVPDETLQSIPSIWVDTTKGDTRKGRRGRATPHKASKASSPSSSSQDSSPADLEKETVGFLPKLSRILEGKESKVPRRRRSSTISPQDDPTSARRRRMPTENASLNRRTIRQKHGSLQRRVESLADLPNPSLISVLSGLTQQSNTSSGSNSTITQQSYDNKHIVKRKPPKERKRLHANAIPPKSKTGTMATQQPSVFRYMNESLSSEQFLNGNPQGTQPMSYSTSSSTSSRYSEDDGHSSNAEQPVVESPMTSPASMRRPNQEGSHDDDADDDESDSDNDVSVAEVDHVSDHQPSVSDDLEESDGQEEVEEGNVEDEDSDDGDYDENASATRESEYHRNSMALERAPPRMPSTSSSRHSDRHTRRLRRQEQALNEHVLQSPQPHRDFQFFGEPSPYPHPAMPMYDPYLQSGVSPVNHYATTHHAPPPAPPPPPVGYYSPPHAPPAPYSPSVENNMAMASRPPMSASNTFAQPPPFSYSPAHPPHYQQHSTGPDLNKTTIVGYELLADKLGEGSKHEQRSSREEAVVPLYRRFEQLNHRVLLHLQDEISESEEELRYLDECIAQFAARDERGNVYPASRRGDARYGNDLHFRRTELLGRIYLKLGQYSKCSTLYSSGQEDFGAKRGADYVG